MSAIKNIVFDLGGVLVDLDRNRAVKRFEQIGVKDAEQLIDAYEQKGIFLEVENGTIDSDEFCRKVCAHVDVPQYKLDYLLELRKNYRVYLLSNTNPIIQSWARSPEFTSVGLPISAYFDKMYTSYEVGITKPNPFIFDFMIKDADLKPIETLFVDDGSSNIAVGKQLNFRTYQPDNGEDWRDAVSACLL